MSPVPPVASAPPARTRPFYWSVRRELWENRSVCIAPVAVGALLLIGFAISTIGLPDRRRALLALDPAKQAATVAQPYDVAAAAVLVTMLVVGVTYCLGALHGERRDRSILFWKSLPVSDPTTVLAKAAVPLAVLPVIAFGVVLCVQVAMALWSGAILAANGLWSASTQVPLPRMTLVLAYGLVTLTLWWAPLYAWFLLVSAWARRVPLLWAMLPPVGLALVERVALGSAHIASFLGQRLVGSYEAAFVLPVRPVGQAARHAMFTSGPPQLDPAKFLASPGLWSGLALAAGLLAGAVWLRRRQEPI